MNRLRNPWGRPRFLAAVTVLYIVWSVVPVCGARGIPAYIHPSDRALLSDPARGLPPQAGRQR